MRIPSSTASVTTSQISIVYTEASDEDLKLFKQLPVAFRIVQNLVAQKAHHLRKFTYI